MADYARPEVLVDTRWLLNHLSDPSIRIVEANNDGGKAYATGHIPGAVSWLWRQDLQQPDRHDVPDQATWEALLSRSGIAPETTIVLYGENNWYPAFGFWLLTIYGHRAMRVLDGGRKKWLADGLPTTAEVPGIAPTAYRAAEPDWSLRARADDVQAGLGRPERILVDARSSEEYHGEQFAPGAPAQFGARAGHIPGAVHVPWVQLVNNDGTFKSADELSALYAAVEVGAGQEVIPYCTIGGRSGITWFVLSQLLGYRARLYDGYWGEWGNRLGAPIER